MYRFRDTLPIDISRKTISGDLVTINNPEEMGVIDSLEVSLEPIQDLNGYDKPWVGGAGKNKLPSHAVGTSTLNGLTTTYNGDGTITVNGTATANTDIIVYTSGNISQGLQGTYVLNGSVGGTSSTYRIAARIRDTSAGTNRYVAVLDGDLSVTTSTNEVINSIYIVVSSGVTLSNKVFYPMLRLAYEADATYEPYENICPISGRTSVDTIVSPTTSATDGRTYTTALGRTVYGGTLDVVSGMLTVDTAMVTLNGSETWSASNGTATACMRVETRTNVGFKPNTSNNSLVGDISSAFVEVTPNQTWSGTIGFSVSTDANPHLHFCQTGQKNMSVEAWKTYLASNPIQVVGLLATPQTYQLTPQQIDLLLGTNHLWSDGEISVVWHKDLTKGRILPTEAVSINGQYIENVLDGYRTLYTKGRESLGAELNTYSVGTADGEKFKNKRYPARELTVGFQLIADNAEDFREKFNNLNNLLSLDEADFIFHDEEDKFFSGYPIMNAEVEAGENSVKGEWKIYCAYPFKRSVDPITLTMADATVTNTTATFTIDYKGSQPARPVLRAKFAGAKSGGTSSEDGDCGFVAFMDARENIIQLGNPDVLDLDAYAKAGNLINMEFINTSGWTMTGGHSYKGTVTGTVAVSDAVDAFWDGGKGQTQSYAKPSYGSGTGLHGSILWKNTAGAVNFTLSAVHRLCVNNSNEVGVFELGAYNHSTGKMTAGFVIDKSGNGTTGVVRYIVNAKQVGTDQIDLSYYNTHFGYCNRTPVYVTQKYKQKTWVKVKVKVRRNKYKTKSQVKWVTKTRKVFKGYNYTQSNLNSSIKKDGINVYFQVGNLPRRTFNVPEIEQIVSHDASCYMGTYGTAMNTNMIHSMMFRKETGAVFAEQPNVFTAGDIVEADCNEATVNIYRDGSIGGHLEPQFGALGNDWEDFKLTSGTNIIRATWSDWVNPTYKPQIEIEYNEVFI